MRALIINSVCGVGSTGRICIELADELSKENYECAIAYGRASLFPQNFRHEKIKIGDNIDVYAHVAMSRVFDDHGLHSNKVTKRFLEWAEQYNPELLWLHNIHGYYINYELLFDWIKKRPDMKVRWTLHDCWAFTGHCSHFTVVNCQKWQKQCSNCPQKKRYPKSILFDNSRSNFERKKKAFCDVTNLTIITPSKWLQNLVKKSFLNKYPIEVHHNKVDRKKFKPTENSFRIQHNLENKFVILGVTSGWTDRKGLDDFLELSKMLDDDFRIVLVGLNDNQIKAMPSNVLGMKKTNSTEELAGIYTMADVFVNASKEETFGLTTLEAIYCGTFPIVYKDTACEEVVSTYGGVAVERGVENIFSEIMLIKDRK